MQCAGPTELQTGITNCKKTSLQQSGQVLHDKHGTVHFVGGNNGIVVMF